MNKLLFFLIFYCLSTIAYCKTFQLPQGPGRCPHFSFTGEESWEFKSDRKKGDRWWLLDSKTKKRIMRFDFDLPNTDQKMLPEVEDSEIQLGKFKVSKYTVTMDVTQDAKTASEDLVTSYRFPDGPLHGLLVMTDKYNRSSGIIKRIEVALAGIEIKK